MIGDTWNTLVAPPSERELDAALAAVRVRAIGHARRRTARARATMAIGFVLVAAAGVALGRNTASGVRLLEDEPDDLSSSAGEVFLTTPSAPVTRSALPSGVRRIHITSWSEVDGLRMNESEAWIEGPEGLGFQIIKGMSEASLNARAYVQAERAGVGVTLSGWVVRRLGWTRHGGYVEERRHFGRSVTLGAGQVAMLEPFGRAMQPGEPHTVIHIDGPFAAAPASVEWAVPDTTNLASWDRTMLAEGVRRGLRIAIRNPSAMAIRPMFLAPRVRLRVRLAGHEPSAWVTAPATGNGVSLVIPGLAGGYRVTAALGLDGERSVDACAQIQPSLTGQPGTMALSRACFPKTAPYAPVELRLRDGRSMTVERREP